MRDNNPNVPPVDFEKCEIFGHKCDPRIFALTTALVASGIRPSRLDWDVCPQALFRLGQLTATPGIRPILHPEHAAGFLKRHITGDWGDVCPHDKKANDAAVQNGGRILSSYKTADGEAFWIITEADRSVTTILLPSEY